MLGVNALWGEYYRVPVPFDVYFVLGVIIIAVVIWLIEELDRPP